MKLEKKIDDHDHDKYITTQEFNKLTSKNFAARLAKANLASKNDVVNLLNKTDFDDKLKNLDKKVTSNKTRRIEVETKLDDLEEQFKIISTKGLPADWINKYSFLNGAKYVSSDGLQNYLVLVSTRCIDYISNHSDKIES